MDCSFCDLCSTYFGEVGWEGDPITSKEVCKLCYYDKCIKAKMEFDKIQEKYYNLHFKNLIRKYRIGKITNK